MKKAEKQVIELEDYAKNEKHVPSGVCYKIKIDRENYLVDDQCLTGRQLLELAGKEPYTRFQINQKMRGGLVKKIG